MDRVKFDSEIVVPDPDNSHNYMLDTSAINEIAENIIDLGVLIQSTVFEYRYFKTSMQEYELNGVGARTYDKNCISSAWKNTPEWLHKKTPTFNEIIRQLNIRRVSSVVSMMLNHTILDGTFRFLEDQGAPTELFNNILHLIDNKPKLKNDKPFAYHYDAMIAEAAMYHNCFLVTNDNDLFIEVNKLFPKRAIRYVDFIDTVKYTVSKKE